MKYCPSNESNMYPMSPKILSTKKLDSFLDFHVGQKLDLSGAKDLLSSSGHDTNETHMLVGINRTIYDTDLDKDRCVTDLVVENTRTQCRFCFEASGEIGKKVKIYK